MTVIRVTYRATFEQPRGKLNPLGVRLKGPIRVELFQGRKSWFARSLSAPGQPTFKEIADAAGSDSTKNNVEACFETKLEDWSMWLADAEGSFLKLNPDDIEIRPGGVVCLLSSNDKARRQALGSDRV